MKYLVLHKFNRVEKDAVIDLDKNHFLTNYWIKKGYIKPYIIEEELSKVVETNAEQKPKKKRKIVKKKVEKNTE